jgi:hypothetical protein
MVLDEDEIARSEPVVRRARGRREEDRSAPRARASAIGEATSAAERPS